MADELLTIGEVATILQQPDWLVRRAVDAVAPDADRVGQYRVVPRGLLTRIAAEIERRQSRQSKGVAE